MVKVDIVVVKLCESEFGVIYEVIKIEFVEVKVVVVVYDIEMEMVRKEVKYWE